MRSGQRSAIQVYNMKVIVWTPYLVKAGKTKKKKKNKKKKKDSDTVLIWVGKKGTANTAKVASSEGKAD